MITIQIDEQLAHDLQQIAEREDRPVADVLRTMVAQYPVLPTSNGDEPTESETPIVIANSEPAINQPSANGDRPVRSEAWYRVRRKAYAKARQYWESVGDKAKVALTDEELDEQFQWFDEEGIPRLKSELTSLEPPVGSGAYAAKMAREANLHLGNSIDASRADEILNAEFADYLLKRMRGEENVE